VEIAKALKQELGKIAYMVIKRDVQMLLLGILIAFFAQVFYDFIHEGIVTPRNSQPVWEGVQALILMAVLILIYVVLKAKTY
jgi:hypothetical protein